MTEFFSFALPGVPDGCTFALVAVGLVLTYQATGVFNFAFGSEAYAAAVLYSELYWHGVSPLLAALLVVFVVGPLFGALLDFGFFSRIPPGNPTAKIVTALGVMVFLPEIVQLIIGPVTIYAPPPPLFGPQLIGRWDTVALNGTELSTIVCTAGVLLVLTLILRSRRLGLPIRAAVESPKLLELAGVDSRWVLRGSWMISTSLAGLAGVLFSAHQTTVDSTTFSLVLVAAVAAAAIGGLRSMAWAAVGGVALGVIQNVVKGYLPPSSVWYQAFLPSLPFFILLLVLIVHPSLRRLSVATDPMGAVEPPAPPPVLALRPPNVNHVVRRFRWPFLVLTLVATVTFVPGPWIASLTWGSALAIIFLSITLMTGLAGQLSLAQAAFAGIGAFATVQLAVNEHVPILFAALAGAVVAGIGGVLASLPALRLRGLPITLLTLCLALLADNLLFPTSWIGGGSQVLVVPRPHIFDINMDNVDSKSFFILVFVVLLIVTGIVHLLLRGTTGRALAATHASPVGALSSGVAVRRFTVILFAMSAAIAGLGGAFYSMSWQAVNPVDYIWFLGPTYLVIVVTMGVTTVEGAIAAGLAYALLTQVVAYLPSRGGTSSAQSAITILVLSIGAFTYAKHPEGIIEFVKHKIAPWLFRPRAPDLDTTIDPLLEVANEVAP